MSKRLVSIDSTANRVGVSRRSVYRLIDDRLIDSVKVRGRRLVDDDSIDRYIESLIEESHAAA